MFIERAAEGVEITLRRVGVELFDGYDSPKAVRLRSEEILAASEPILAEIEQVKSEWGEKLAGKWEEDKKRLIADKVAKIRVDKESFRSVIEAVGLAAAVFEKTVFDEKGKPIKLRRCQLAAAFYLLNGASLKMGKEDKKFSLEEPPGEGKTFVIGVAAGADAVLGNKVHIVTPSYFLAQRDSGWLGGYYYRLLGPKEGKVSAVINKSNSVHKRVLVPHTLPQPVDDRKQFIYQPDYINSRLQEEDKRLVHLKPLASRREAYSRMVVYVDSDSIPFDWLRQNRFERGENHVVFGTSEEGVFKEGDLSEITAYVDEADNILLDKARCPYVLSETLREEALWQYAEKCLGLDQVVADTVECLGLDKQISIGNLAEQPAKRMEFAQRIMLAIWRALELDPRDTLLIKIVSESFGISSTKETKKTGKVDYSKLREKIYEIAFSDQSSLEISPEKMKDLDVLVCSDGVLISERYYTKLKNVLKLCLDEVFSEMFPLYDPQPKKLGLIIESWLNHFGWPFIQQAAEVYFSQNEGKQFINRKRGAVLVDRNTGLPMERRQLQGWAGFFFQIKTNWKRWLAKFKPEGIVTGFEDWYKKVEDFYPSQVQISREVGRLPSLVLYGQLYKKARFISATLTSEAREMRRLFGADTLVMGRYLPISKEEQWRPTKGKSPTSIEIEESDGGPLAVEFCRNSDSADENIIKIIKNRGKRPVLCVVETIKEAERLYNKAIEAGIAEADLQIATARTEMPAEAADFLVVQERTVSFWKRERPQISETVVNAGAPAKVTIATLLASRGVHIYLTDEARQAGGLIELIRGIFPNRRAFLQVIGRALRGSDPGYRKVYLYPQEPNALWMRFWPQMKSVRCLLSWTDRKIREQAFNKAESLWQAALNGDKKAMRELWQAVKKAQDNRYGEEVKMRRNSYLRDFLLPACLQSARKALEKKFPILKSTAYKTAKEREEEKALRKLLDFWWSDFLISLDKCFFNFSNSYRLSPRFRDQFWAAEVEKLLSSQLEDLIVQLEKMGFKRRKS